MAIDQAMSQYTDSIVEEELKKQQVKIDAAITTLGLSTLQLPEDNPLRIALHGKPKGSTQI